MNQTDNIKIFPVVERIRNEIDFCFTAFYGNFVRDKEICDIEFNEWLKLGHRGPGKLPVYIDLLEKHLGNSTQKSIFRNLAMDAITLTKKSKPQEKSSFIGKHKVTIAFNLIVLVLFAYYAYYNH